MARPHALVALVAAVLLGETARADVIDLPDTYASITLDPAVWKPAGKPGLVAGYATDRGELLAITRAQLPNIDAWRTKHRDAYIDQIEKGLVALGYKTSSRKLSTIEGVPVLDLEATVDRKARRDTPREPSTARREPETQRGSTATRRDPIVLRVILFRTYALSLALEGPRSSRTAFRAIAKTFVPPPARPEGSP